MRLLPYGPTKEDTPCRMDSGPILPAPGALGQEGQSGNRPMTARRQFSLDGEEAEGNDRTVPSAVVHRHEDRVRRSRQNRHTTASIVTQRRLVQHRGGTTALAVAHARADDRDGRTVPAHRSAVILAPHRRPLPPPTAGSTFMPPQDSDRSVLAPAPR